MNTMILRLVLWLSLVSLSALAQASEETVSRTGANATEQSRLSLPNITVRDDRNHEHQLSTLLQDHVVVMDFIFTTCTTLCPALSATLQATQKQLQGRLGKEVILVSISVDPARDTPEKLRRYAEKFEAGPYWYWLTGRPSDIFQLLKVLGIPTGRPEDHPPVFLVGNAPTGQWKRWVGIPSPETLVGTVDQLIQDNL